MSMTKFRQIINALNLGVSFSWGLDGMSAPEPTGELAEICEGVDEAKIGFHTQVFLGRIIHFENYKITYVVSHGYVKIYY